MLGYEDPTGTLAPRLLYSGGDSDAPPNEGRMRMLLRQSLNGGASWEAVQMLDQARVAYSQLVTLPTRPGQVGVLWEVPALADPQSEPGRQ